MCNYYIIILYIIWAEKNYTKKTDLANLTKCLHYTVYIYIYNFVTFLSRFCGLSLIFAAYFTLYQNTKVTS